ncbi:MAG: fasciclin domain-containing protein [Acidimicrobiia bacterium]|nr:fasciclin domain-containing protein [Acidimicrobiia bacterium]
MITVAALALGACSSSTSNDKADTKPAKSTTTAPPAVPDQTIVEIASSNPDFSTLVAAVKAAGLVETLSGEGPFTVFAPTNEAFAKLPAGTVDTLLLPENQQKLSDILTYHVVSGTVLAADVQPGAVTTVNGADFTISVEGGDVIITDGEGNQSKIVQTDIEASNGVIHVIDTVLLPPAA